MFPRIARYRTVDEVIERFKELSIDLPIDHEVLTAESGSPLASPLTMGSITAGNRFVIHPMEGWDATSDGLPTEPLLRRWRRFGISGAKCIWGGEAVAVVPQGRAHPHQLEAGRLGTLGMQQLCSLVHTAHREKFGTDEDLVVALQLTHSGRYARPTVAGASPRIAYHHPVLDSEMAISSKVDPRIVSDQEIEKEGGIIDTFVCAAENASAAGFDMVDVKACHSYLIHEFLSARRRPGRWGGDFEGRTRLLCSIVERIRERVPRLAIGVRLSIFDTVPWRKTFNRGEPLIGKNEEYDCGFGINIHSPHEIDLAEPIELVRRLRDLGVVAVNLTAGSPYNSPHISRPALFPPSDGYPPPEDPLIGVARQIHAARKVKQAVEGIVTVGTAYTYLQEYLPHVAQATVRSGWIDAVGLGRMVLSYPEFPTDILTSGKLARTSICRTFSDCTSGPRNGLASGCYPLDEYYKRSPDGESLRAIKSRE